LESERPWPSRSRIDTWPLRKFRFASGNRDFRVLGTPSPLSQLSTHWRAVQAISLARPTTLDKAMRMLVFVIAMLASGGAPCLAAKRVALVIGNDAYRQVAALRKAVTDANAVASALRSIGFTVLVAENQDRQTMSQTLLHQETENPIDGRRVCARVRFENAVE